jgi:hypothetical protein
MRDSFGVDCGGEFGGDELSVVIVSSHKSRSSKIALTNPNKVSQNLVRLLRVQINVLND